MIWLIITSGISLSFRPGATSISRMLSDHSNTLPHFYIVFVLLIYELNRGHTKVKKAFTYFQILGFILIPVSDVDEQTAMHLFAAALLVTASVGREIYSVYEELHEENINSKHWKLIAAHIFVISLIVICAISFLIATIIIPNYETSTYFAYFEYVLFFLITAVNVFHLDE